MEWVKWLKLILILITIICILTGFLIGYLYGDKDCIENPFNYGIKKMNDVHDDNFTCFCSGSKELFSFSEE